MGPFPPSDEFRDGQRRLKGQVGKDDRKIDMVRPLLEAPGGTGVAIGWRRTFSWSMDGFSAPTSFGCGRKLRQGMVAIAGISIELLDSLRLADWKQAYYGDNYEELRRIKLHYDPNHLFRFPQDVLQ